jgi:hypothetical protein
MRVDHRLKAALVERLSLVVFRFGDAVAVHHEQVT